MGIETGTALLIAAAASAGAAAYSANKQAGAQEDANRTATANAKATAKAADEASNKANQKQPDAGAMLSANLTAGKAGQSSTLLTGAGGIDPNSLTLGKTTLLGGGGT
jgi:acyl-coenzyme A synthetase/AMP-(fatty) acid ligase